MLPALHAFTGCDTTSSFVRRGKIALLKILEKKSEFVSLFQEPGESVNVKESSLDDLERFVCSMYGKPKYTSVNKLCYDLFMKKFMPKPGQLLSSGDGIDLSLLPPRQDSLQMHIIQGQIIKLLY